MQDHFKRKRSFFGQSTLLPAFVAVESIQRGQGEVMAYLDEMGIDPLVMQHALITPPDEIYVLLPEELRAYRITGNRDWLRFAETWAAGVPTVP